MDTSRYKALFLQETYERLNGIEKGLLSLEARPREAQTIDALFRHYHSVKGMCASMGYTDVMNFAHAQEDLLDRFRKTGDAPSPSTISLLFESLDMLKEMIRCIENDITGDIDPSTLIKKIKDAAVAAPNGSLPVKTETVEPTTPRITLARTMKVEGRVFDELLRITGDFLSNLSGLKNMAAKSPSIKFKDKIHRIEKTVNELQKNILGSRMLRFGEITEGLPRIVRDIAQRYGKEVTLKISGEDITLDRSILEGMGDPLVHCIKNAVDHGIESPAERKEAGKPEKGAIEVSIKSKKDRVEISVFDDGRGIDAEKLKRKALEKGLPPEKISGMSEKEALMLVCLPGVSLSSAVTDVSGRGVGMDIVHSAVISLGGKLAIESVFNSHTNIIMELPRSASIMKILLVRAGEEVFGIPSAKIEKVMDITSADVKSGRIMYKEEAVPAENLRKIFDVAGGENAGKVAVICREEDKDGFFAVTVCDYEDEFDCLVHPLHPPFSKLRGAVGYTITGEGRPVFILDTSHIASAIARLNGQGTEQ